MSFPSCIITVGRRCTHLQRCVTHLLLKIAGKTAILSSVNKFMSVNEEDDSIVARNSAARDEDVCNIRSNKSRELGSAVVAEEEGDLTEVELNYV